VFAHAVLGHHENVVRYFSAWAEDKYMLIQNEYCNGGSLQDVIENNRANNRRLSEPELRHLISHVAEGLRFIHSRNLVHMDIKPANIFISRDTTQVQCDSDNSIREDEESQITYKIGESLHQIHCL
jgi:wee1-like protein kinase